jgi:uncharacterized protein YjbI with pentapeptide repeats
VKLLHAAAGSTSYTARRCRLSVCTNGTNGTGTNGTGTNGTGTNGTGTNGTGTNGTGTGTGTNGTGTNGTGTNGTGTNGTGTNRQAKFLADFCIFPYSPPPHYPFSSALAIRSVTR